MPVWPAAGSAPLSRDRRAVPRDSTGLRIMRRLFASFLVTGLLWALPLVASGQVGAGVPGQKITLAERSYWLNAPASGDTAPGPLPVLIALHGGGGNPGQFERNAGLAEAALARGFVVVLPAGTGRLGLLTWNAGHCCGPAAASGVDDVAFLDAVLSDLRTRLGPQSIGPVFLSGMSNGAMMAQAYAAARPDVVSGVGAVSGTPDLDRFAPRGAVPLLLLHGTADDHIPFEGGIGPSSRWTTPFRSVQATIEANLARWRPLGVAGPRHRALPRKGPLRATEDLWTLDGQPVLSLITIEGGAHVWPGGRAEARRGGPSGIDANDLILDFFAARIAAGG